jgi:hypothetical protein
MRDAANISGSPRQMNVPCLMPVENSEPVVAYERRLEALNTITRPSTSSSSVLASSRW